MRLSSIRQNRGTILVENIADIQMNCDTNPTRSDQSLYGRFSDDHVDDIEALVKDIYNLELSLKGVYSCRDMRRNFHDPRRSEIILYTETAVVTGFHSVPTTEHRKEIIAQGWPAYRACQCGEEFLIGNYQDPFLSWPSSCTNAQKGTMPLFRQTVIQRMGLHAQCDNYTSTGTQTGPILTSQTNENSTRQRDSGI